MADDLAQALARRARNGDQHFLRLDLLGDIADAGDRTTHRDAADARAPLHALIVDEGDDLAELAAMLDLAGQRLARVAGADDDQAALVSRQSLIRGTETIAPEADREARAEKSQQRERPVHQDHAARHLDEAALVREHVAGEPERVLDRGRRRQSEDEADDVGNADVAPPAAVEAEQEIGRAHVWTPVT